jgi:hypothetical protein
MSPSTVCKTIILTNSRRTVDHGDDGKESKAAEEESMIADLRIIPMALMPSLDASANARLRETQR